MECRHSSQNALTHLHLRSPDNRLAREFESCGGVANASIDTGRVLEALWAAPTPDSGETLRKVFRDADHRPSLAEHLRQLAALFLRHRAVDFGIARGGSEYKALAKQKLPFQCRQAHRHPTSSVDDSGRD